MAADSVGVNKTRNDIKDLDNKIDIKSKDVDDKKESRWPIVDSSWYLDDIVGIGVYIKKIKVL